VKRTLAIAVLVALALLDAALAFILIAGTKPFGTPIAG
jgi:hypothetical protein